MLKIIYNKIYRQLAIIKNNIFRDYYLYFNKSENKEILIYCGMNVGDTFNKIFYEYNKVIGFEANPENYNILIKKFSKYKNVEIHNCVLSKYDGYCDFNIVKDNNFSASSSILNFHKDRNLNIEKVIKVKSINLYRFLKGKNLQKIDTYISDIEGYDFVVLKTLEPLIKNKNISKISCEVQINEKINYFETIEENNSISNFRKLLSENYEIEGFGSGITKENKNIKFSNFENYCNDYRKIFGTNDNFIDITWLAKN